MRGARKRVTASYSWIVARECLAHRAHKISAGRLPSSPDPPPAPPHPPSAALLVFTRNICTNRRFVTRPFFCPPSFRPPTAPTKRPFFSSHPPNQSLEPFLLPGHIVLFLDTSVVPASCISNGELSMNAVARAFAPPLYFTDPRARLVDVYRGFR